MVDVQDRDQSLFGFFIELCVGRCAQQKQPLVFNDLLGPSSRWLLDTPNHLEKSDSSNARLCRLRKSLHIVGEAGWIVLDGVYAFLWPKGS